MVALRPIDAARNAKSGGVVCVKKGKKKKKKRLVSRAKNATELVLGVE